MDTGNAAHILNEKLSKRAATIAGDDGQVSHLRALVDAFVDAFDGVGTWAKIHKVVLIRVYVPRAPTVHDECKSHGINRKAPRAFAAALSGVRSHRECSGSDGPGGSRADGESDSRGASS